MSEPVAFRWKLQTPISDVGYIYDVFDYGGGEPLYTHPAKELTDEEIDKLAKKFGVVGLHEDAGLYEFVREILNNG